MSQIEIGSRMIVTSFKMRNQEGIVKYVGNVPGKIG